MRIEFDSSVPLAEQIKRAGGRKKVGHKHERQPGPCRKKKADDRAWVSRLRKWKAEVSAYFHGDIDVYPEFPGKDPK